MKKTFFCSFAILLGLECFSQATNTATASISATIINVDELVKEAGYNTPSKLSPADKMHIADSMLSAQEKIKIKILLSKRTVRMQAESATYASAAGQLRSFKVIPLTKEQKWYGQVHLSVWEDIWGMMRFHNKTPPKRKSKALKGSFFWCS